MSVTANSSGVVTGKFAIPSSIPAGSKQVSFIGSGGSKGDAVFVGSGNITTQTLQQVNTVTTRLWDPLAQTFSLTEATQVAAVDIWFAAVGTSKIVVQIRETIAGVPSQSLLGEARLQPQSILTASHTRVVFDAPINLLKNTEYALVVLCDDAVTELRVAELGKWDAVGGRWVTSQPYQVGVLLSSSNASTWTPHQDRDLAFRIHRAVYTESTRSVVLGSVAVTNASDLMLLSVVETPASNTRVEFFLTLPNGDVITAASGQPVLLGLPITGDVTVSARLNGTASSSPVLLPGTQLVVGSVQTTADYYTRFIPGGASVRVKVVFDAFVPGGSSVTVKYKGDDGGDVWATVPYVSSTNVNDGFIEFTHQVTGVNEDVVQVKLELTGTTSARPRVKNLRVMVL